MFLGGTSLKDMCGHQRMLRRTPLSDNVWRLDSLSKLVNPQLSIHEVEGTGSHTVKKDFQGHSRESKVVIGLLIERMNNRKREVVE